MNGHSWEIGELLERRIGSMGALAVLAVVGFVYLRWLHATLVRRKTVLAPTPTQRSLLTDIGFIILSPVMEVMSRTLTTLAIVVCATLAGRHLGPDLLGGFGPVSRQPRWLIVAEMLVLSDFIYYWIHRAAHTFPLLWRLHAIHHSTKHLRWSSALRAHPAEVYLHVLTVVPLFMLGFPVDGLVVAAPFITLYAVLIHSNTNFAVRALGYVVNSPRYHGWHHALDAKDGGVNFAGFFPIFDALFGTYKLPDELPPAYGQDDPDMPETCVEQLVYPFRPLPSEAPILTPQEALSQPFHDRPYPAHLGQ